LRRESTELTETRKKDMILPALSIAISSIDPLILFFSKSPIDLVLVVD
jgi:hypothetical protein